VFWGGEDPPLFKTMTKLILISVSLLAVSAWGQATDTIIVDSGFIRVSSQSTMYPDSLHDPSAKFDTLYWRCVCTAYEFYVNTYSPGIVRDTAHQKCTEWEWHRIDGRWDTTTVRVCDTVWTTTDQWWQASSVISVGGDTTIRRLRQRHSGMETAIGGQRGGQAALPREESGWRVSSYR
jgi:hypothetical protein